MRFPTWVILISIGCTLADARELRGLNLRGPDPDNVKTKKSFFLDDRREWEDEIWKRVFFDGDGSMSMPSPSPSRSPTSKIPTRRPSKVPVPPETDAPTRPPTIQPSAAPKTKAPTQIPTKRPITKEPTNQPLTPLPTRPPSREPSAKPSTEIPTEAPFPEETLPPTPEATTLAPTSTPTQNITTAPTQAPVPPETANPTRSPTKAPTNRPTLVPTKSPTKAPFAPPSRAPTKAPFTSPTRAPTRAPALPETPVPTSLPTGDPTAVPTVVPTRAPAPPPTAAPTRAPATLAPVTLPPVTTAPTASLVTLIELVRTRPRLSTLSSLVTIADQNRTVPPQISNVLGSAGPFTLFAPTNAAFTKLEEIEPGYLQQISTPEFSLHLFVLLAYHTAPGALRQADFPVTNLAMLDGGSTNVTDGPPYFVQSFSPSRAQVVAPPDVVATNGVMHFIDNVLLPRFIDQNYITALESQGDQFSTWLRLIEAAGLTSTFANFNNVSMLAPINSAIPLETEQFLLQPGNEEVLTAVLSYHVMLTMFNYAIQSVPNLLLVNTTQFQNIVVGILLVDDAGNVSVSYNQATQIGFFLSRTNIIYVVDTLLIPPSLATVVPRTSSVPLSSFRMNETSSLRRPDSQLMMGEDGPT